ncbi:MAG: hypothetical protein J0L86_13510 [Flavobacteriales bacterium]|nr:hypothetical protein [Flavobacteriales bacterium]
MKTESIEVLEKTKIEKGVKKEQTPGCCGGAPTNNKEACCKLDEDKKADGEDGCGCNSSAEKSKSTCC